MKKTYAVTHTMETPIRSIGYQYYLINPETEEKMWADDTDIAVLSRPVNSVLNLSDFLLPVGIDVFGNFIRPMQLNELTITGYNMSTVGWQTITFSYVNADGKTLTCTTTLHVFGDTTWRTIWPAVEDYTENVSLINGEETLGISLKVNDTESNWNGGTTTPSCFLPSESRNVEAVDIGEDVTRKLRLTYALNDDYNISGVKVYGQSQPRDEYEHIVEFDWNKKEQMPVKGNTKYLDIINGTNGWPIIYINKSDGTNYLHQMIYAVLWFTDTSASADAQPKGKALLDWTIAANNAFDPESSELNDIVGQSVHIKKIEVLE